MAPANSKYIDSRFDRLTEENTELRREIEQLKECVSALKSELQGLQFVVSENIERREAVETNLASVDAKYSILQSDLSSVNSMCSAISDSHTKLQSAVEVQAQYSRLSTLLLSGGAIPEYRPGEDTKAGILMLIREFLGISIHPLAISACHRLRNRNTVLLRFVNLAEREAVYRQRVRPLKPGLAIHESLTSERLEVVKILKALHHPKDKSPLQTHYTDKGKIFIKPKGASRAIEVQVGSTREDILALCNPEGRSMTDKAPRSGARPSSKPQAKLPSLQHRSPTQRLSSTQINPQAAATNMTGVETLPTAGLGPQADSAPCGDGPTVRGTSSAGASPPQGAYAGSGKLVVLSIPTGASNNRPAEGGQVAPQGHDVASPTLPLDLPVSSSDEILPCADPSSPGVGLDQSGPVGFRDRSISIPASMGSEPAATATDSPLSKPASSQPTAVTDQGTPHPEACGMTEDSLPSASLSQGRSRSGRAVHPPPHKFS